jgi:hypothetical protein
MIFVCTRNIYLNRDEEATINEFFTIHIVYGVHISLISSQCETTMYLGLPFLLLISHVVGALL